MSLRQMSTGEVCRDDYFQVFFNFFGTRGGELKFLSIGISPKLSGQDWEVVVLSICLVILSTS